jgi:hypothetical protein
MYSFMGGFAAAHESKKIEEKSMDKSLNGKLRVFVVSALMAGSLFAVTSSAHATLSLNYTLDSSNPQASVFYNPALDLYLHGKSIGVSTISGTETAQNAGNSNALSISGGALNFVTGAFTGQTGNTWNFAGGGSISVTGGIVPLSLANGSNLLSGTFTSATVTELPLFGQLKFDIVGATFNDAEHQMIYNYFGIPANSSSAEGMNLSFLATGMANGGFASTSIASGSIVDVPTPTPVPAAAWLLGSGLFGLVGMKKRKQA